MRQIGLIILLFFTSLAYAQNVEFKASAPSVVAVGEQFKLEYTLNKEGDNLKVPTLEGFDRRTIFLFIEYQWENDAECHFLLYLYFGRN